jgi:hypothetical protein
MLLRSQRKARCSRAGMAAQPCSRSHRQRPITTARTPRPDLKPSTRRQNRRDRQNHHHRAASGLKLTLSDQAAFTSDSILWRCTWRLGRNTPQTWLHHNKNTTNTTTNSTTTTPQTHSRGMRVRGKRQRPPKTQQKNTHTQEATQQPGIQRSQRHLMLGCAASSKPEAVRE